MREPRLFVDWSFWVRSGAGSKKKKKKVNQTWQKTKKRFEWSAARPRSKNFLKKPPEILFQYLTQSITQLTQYDMCFMG